MLRSAVSRLTELFRRVTVADEKPISVTLLSLGLILTFVEYKNYQANERVKTSYQHVREWEERGYKEAFDQVSGVIRETKAKALDAMPQELLEPTATCVTRRCWRISLAKTCCALMSTPRPMWPVSGMKSTAMRC